MSGAQFLIDNAGTLELFSDQTAFGNRLDQLERTYVTDYYRDNVKVYRVRVMNKRDVLHRFRARLKLGHGAVQITHPRDQLDEL